MKFPRLTFIFLLLPFAVFGSPRKKIDSTLKALSTQKDSARISSLTVLAQYFKSVNPDSAMLFALQLKKEAEQTENPAHVCDAYVVLAACYYHENEIDSAVLYRRLAISIAEKAKYQKGLANVYNDYALYKRDVGEMDSAAYFLLKAAAIREKIEDEKGLATCYVNLGLVYYSQKDIPSGLEYCKKSEAIFLKLREMKSYAVALNAQGAMYDDLKKYSEALVVYNKALAIRDSLNDKRGIGESEINIAVAYRNLGDLDKAETFLLKALKLKREISDVSGEAACLLDLSQTYRLRKKFDLAAVTLQRSDSLCRITREKELRRDIFLEYANLYSDQGQFEKAYFFLGKYQEVKDSIFNEDKIKTVSEMQTKYQTGIKEKENIKLKEKAAIDALAMEKDRNQKIFLYAGIGILVLVLALAFYAYSVKIKSNKQITKRNQTLKELNLKLIESEEELLLLNKTKDKLFSVISHDISNPVKAIANYNQAILSRANELTREELADALKKVNQSVQPLQGFIDNLLHWSLLQRNGATVNPEKFSATEIVSEIISLYAPYANQKKISLTNKIPERTIVFADKNMLRLVLRNLLSNALKYSNEGGTVEVAAITSEKNIRFEVRDEGSGMDENKIDSILSGKKIISEKGTFAETGTGLGLNLVTEYLRLSGSELEIKSAPGKGTTFSFNLPVQS